MALKATIISLKDGYTHLEDLRSITIVSKGYNIMIMEDYVPLIGEVDGSVSFTAKNGEKTEFSSVHGYYRHCRNEFSFMMEV